MLKIAIEIETGIVRGEFPKRGLPPCSTSINRHSWKTGKPPSSVDHSKRLLPWSNAIFSPLPPTQGRGRGERG